MSAAGITQPHNHDLERFLHASVGEDRKGDGVTVLSALARLNLDPWEEAADLAALGREAAGARLGSLLSRFRDVPALGKDHAPVAQDLTRLLPERLARAAISSGTETKAATISSGLIWTLLAVLFFVMQFIFTDSSGSSQ